MHSFEATQSAFASALLDPDKAVPAQWIDPDAAPSARRFGVYRNNVIAGLSNTLGDAFPVVKRLVGDEFFHAMACRYVRQDPPCSPVLLEYGSAFPDFIEAFEPASVVPYLADVARFERAWVECYHAREVSAGPCDWAHLAPADFERAKVVFHPSLRVVSSSYPVRTIWDAHRDDQIVPDISLEDGPQDTMFVRPQASIKIVPLRPGAARFLEALLNGRAAAHAYEEAAELVPSFDLVATIADIAASDAVVSIDIPD